MKLRPASLVSMQHMLRYDFSASYIGHEDSFGLLVVLTTITPMAVPCRWLTLG